MAQRGRDLLVRRWGAVQSLRLTTIQSAAMPRTLPRREPALQKHHVARLARVVEEPFPEGRYPAMAEAEFAAVTEGLVAELGDGPFWIFAISSLIWNPAFDFVQARPAVAHGWRRSFCMDMQEWRGTPDQPGLMLALDRGGSCVGMAYQMPPGDTYAQMLRLVKREYYYRGDEVWRRWLTVRTRDEVGGQGCTVRALHFYCAPTAHRDVIRLPLHDQARRLARAVGPAGSCVEYLHNTVTHLEALGIHDRYLWALQAMVAAEIDAAKTEATGT